MSSYNQTDAQIIATVARIEAGNGRAANRQAHIADLLRCVTKAVDLSTCGTTDMFGEVITPASRAGAVLGVIPALTAILAMTEEQWVAEYIG